MSVAYDPTIKTRLLLRPLVSPLGTIRLAGINQGGFGVGRPPDPRRTLDCYSLIFLLNGTGVYSDRNIDHTPVAPGDLVIFFPGQPHQCSTHPGEFWNEIWFEFEGPVFDLLHAHRLISHQRPIHHTQDRDHWFRRFMQILPPVHLREKTPPQVIVTRFLAVLSELVSGIEAPDDPAQSNGDDWLNRACDLLTSREGAIGLAPESVARTLGLSYESFRKKFRKSVGFAPGRFHLDSRIDRAAALLLQGRLAVKAIAAELEFCDEFYFSRCFKRRFGQSPRAFRQRVRG